MVNYPAQIDNNISLPPSQDLITPVVGAVVNRLRDAILAVQFELGVKPSGVYTTVRNRLDTLETVLSGLQLDAGGLIVAGTPSVGQTVIWNGSGWIPSTNFINNNIISNTLTITGLTSNSLSSVSQGKIYFNSITNKFLASANGGAYIELGTGGGGGGSFTPGGDLGGNGTAQIVQGIQTFPVSDTTPTVGQFLIWDGYAWSPGNDLFDSSFTAGQILSTALTTGLFTLGGKFVTNGIPTTVTLSNSGQGIIYFDSTLNRYRVSENGGVFRNLAIAPSSAIVGQALIWNGTDWIASTDFSNNNITTSGTLSAGPTTVTSLNTGLEVLNGKLIINAIPTSSSLSDSGQAIIYYNSSSNTVQISENGAAYVDLVGSGGSSPNDLTYPGTFPDWSTFVAACLAAPRPTTVHINADFDVPAGAWTLSTFAQRGLIFDGGTTVRIMTFEDGASIEGYPPDEFHNISLASESNSSVFNINDGNQHSILINGFGRDGSNNQVSLSTSGTGELMTSSSSTELFLTLRDTVTLNTGSAPIITSTGGVVEISAYDSVFIGANTLNNFDNAVTLTIYSSSVSYDVINQVGGPIILDIEYFPATKVLNIISLPYDVSPIDILLTVAIGGTIFLEASPAITRTVKIKDIGGVAATTPITIDGNGHNIDGAATYIMNVNYESLELVYTGSEWSII